MTDLSRVKNLAIIGMDAAAPGSEGLRAYGRLVYRGLTVERPQVGQTAFESIILQNVQRALNAARINPQEIPAFCLSPQPVSILQNGQTYRRVVDFSREINPLTAALSTATDWIDTCEAEAILLVESLPEPQFTCAVILSGEEFAVNNAKTIYAVLMAATESSEPLSALSNALESVGILPEQIGLIETSSEVDPTAGIQETLGMISAYPSSGDPTCALNSSGGGQLTTILKAAWCLYRHVIPGTSDWLGPDQPEIWQDSPFYVPTNSRTWFTSSGQAQRWAGVNITTRQRGFAHILLREGVPNSIIDCEALKEETFYLFPVAALTPGELYRQLTSLRRMASSLSNLTFEAAKAYRHWLAENTSSSLTTCLLAHSPAELVREIDFALKGIPAALEKGSDWQTPLGSYFTTRPLGEQGSISFVYPGGFNSYPGIARDLFYLFPPLYERFSVITDHIDRSLNEKAFYPRSLTALSQTELDQIETKLAADPMAMLISGTSIAVLYTALLREIFAINPASAFGYSLGEISMMFAGGVWTNGDDVSTALCDSPLFRTRLAGPQNAIREYWQMLPQKSSAGPLWENYVIMTAPERVIELLFNEPQVYLTHINTPRQVVIGGDPNACHRIIGLLKCNALQAPFNYALHCKAMQSEYQALKNLLSWPVSGQPDITLYSAATYLPMPIERQSIASQIAHGLCSQLDFPRLVRQVYADGARIFIELGAGSNCAHWIDDTLKDQPHASFSINRKGVDDHTSILKLAARLACQHVQINLNPFYE